MIHEFEEINNLFIELDKKLSHHVNLYIIGGAAMLYRGLKPATKDIDVIVSTKTEFDELQNILLSANFIATIPGKEYERFSLNQIFVRDDFRIDLFQNNVCDKFSLSENMRKRAQTIIEHKYLRVHIISNEDLFLFKTITEREGDIDDCIQLLQQKLSWDDILEELKHQTKEHNVWITWVAERLNLLQEKNLTIPIMKDIDKLCDEYYNKLEKRLKK